MSSFALPRYQDRALVDVLSLGDTEDDPNYQWFAAFAGTSDFRIGWPTIGGSARRTSLGLLGLPRLRIV